jgi:hypothetical protein
MIIVGLKPSPQTQYKFVKPKTSSHFHRNTITSKGLANEQTNAPVDSTTESLSGCLSWLPVMKLGGVKSQPNGKGSIHPTKDITALKHHFT